MSGQRKEIRRIAAEERNKRYLALNLDQKIQEQAKYKGVQYNKLLLIASGMIPLEGNGKNIKEVTTEQVGPLKQWKKRISTEK